MDVRPSRCVEESSVCIAIGSAAPRHGITRSLKEIGVRFEKAVCGASKMHVPWIRHGVSRRRTRRRTRRRRRRRVRWRRLISATKDSYILARQVTPRCILARLVTPRCILARLVTPRITFVRGGCRRPSISRGCSGEALEGRSENLQRLIFMSVQPSSTTLFGVPFPLPTLQGRRDSQLRTMREREIRMLRKATPRIWRSLRQTY